MNDVVAHGAKVRIAHEGRSIGFCRRLLRIILSFVFKLTLASITI